MTLKKKLLTGSIAALLLAGPITAMACGDNENGGWKQLHTNMEQGGRHHGKGHHNGMMMNKKMFKDLDLSRSQRKEIRSIMEKYRDDNKQNHREQIADNKAEFMLALLDGAETNKLNSLMDKNANLMQQTFKNKLPMMQEMVQVLTDGQKAKLSQRLQ